MAQRQGLCVRPTGLLFILLATGVQARKELSGRVTASGQSSQGVLDSQFPTTALLACGYLKADTTCEADTVFSFKDEYRVTLKIRLKCRKWQVT